MKKISLKNLDSLGIERMSKESLKNVNGGSSMYCKEPGEVFFYEQGDWCCNAASITCHSHQDGDRCKCNDDGFNNEEEHQAATNACKDKNAGAPCTIPQKPGKTGTCKQWLTGPLICSFGF